MAKPLVVGNWKMYVETPEEAKKFVAALKRRQKTLTGVELWLAPPFTLLPEVASAVKKSGIKAGAQSVSAQPAGAHTGQVSATMVKSVGASFVIVGHSEERALGETDAVVRERLSAAVKAGLVAVLCIGEDERREDGWHFVHLEAQLRTALTAMNPFSNKIVVAYEPLWAIGKPSGSAMAPHELEETVIFIKKTLTDILGRTAALKVPILYGGSVEPENAHALVAQGGVAGLLVGRASAKAESFADIAKACRK